MGTPPLIAGRADRAPLRLWAQVSSSLYDSAPVWSRVRAAALPTRCAGGTNSGSLYCAARITSEQDAEIAKAGADATIAMAPSKRLLHRIRHRRMRARGRPPWSRVGQL